MKAVVHFVLLAALQRLSSSQSACADGELRLRDGLNPGEGRVEVCFDNQWGTVCDDGWNNTNAMVVCRQLGWPAQGSLAFSSAAFGEGSGPIFIDDARCDGGEVRLVNCSHSRQHNCGHFEDASVRCPYNDTGEVAVQLNGRLLRNNSAILLTDITSDSDSGLVCWSNRDPPVVGSWYGPDGSPIPTTFARGHFYQRNYDTPTVFVLLRSTSALLSGLFTCEILYQSSTTRYLYVGSGFPLVTDLSYNRSSRTLTCMSSGGPATFVTWSLMNDSAIPVDGISYQSSQIITNTSTATYQNTLRLPQGNPEVLYGEYACAVSNSMGAHSSTITVLACDDGDTTTDKDGIVTAVCSNGVFYALPTESVQTIASNNSIDLPVTLTPSPSQATSSSNSIDLLNVLLGTLFGVTFLILVCVVVFVFIWAVIRQKERSYDIPLETRQNVEVQHRNDLFEANPTSSDLSLNAAYNSENVVREVQDNAYEVVDMEENIDLDESVKYQNNVAYTAVQSNSPMAAVPMDQTPDGYSKLQDSSPPTSPVADGYTVLKGSVSDRDIAGLTSPPPYANEGKIKTTNMMCQRPWSQTNMLILNSTRV